MPFLSGEIYYFHVTLLTDSRRGVSAISYVRSSRRRHATLVCDIRFSDNNTSIYYRIQKYQIPTDANRGQYTLLRDVFYILYCYETNRSVLPSAYVFSRFVFPRVQSLRILHDYYVSTYSFHLLFETSAFVNSYFCSGDIKWCMMTKCIEISR